MVIVAVILRFATMCYPSIKQSNFIATPSKYFENLEKHQHHHHQPHSTDFFDQHHTPLTTQVIQYRIQVRS